MAFTKFIALHINEICFKNYESVKICLLETNLCPDSTVNGGWGSWGSYGSCSVTCPTGTKTRIRACDNPAPIHGGLDCPGSDTDTASCTMVPCPSKAPLKIGVCVKKKTNKNQHARGIKEVFFIHQFRGWLF